MSRFRGLLLGVFSVVYLWNGAAVASAETAGGSSAPASEALSIADGVRAQVTSTRHAVISAEIAARIKTMPWREGQSVKSGDTLVEFDCRSYEAQLAQADAQRKEARVNLDVVKKLSNLQASSQLEEQQAQARLEQAEAKVELRKSLVDHCKITAPFSGRINNVSHQSHEVVSAGEKLVELVSDQDMEIEMIVPSSSVRAMPKGKTFVLHLEELGQDLKAEIVRCGGVIDPVSQSVRVFGRIVNPPPGLLPGMSGLAHFELP